MSPNANKRPSYSQSAEGRSYHQQATNTCPSLATHVKAIFLLCKDFMVALQRWLVPLTL